MPARWQSSQKPLFVRTVWVSGRRHAILSRDDPLLRCPRPPSSTSISDTSSESDSCCRLEDCLIKLRLALRPDSYQGSFQESLYPIRHGTVESSHCFDHEDSDSYDDDLPFQKLPLLGQYPKVYSFDGNEHGTFLPELQLNPLSERVLQWLDLSGKEKKLFTSPPPQRAVGQNTERWKSTTADVRKTHNSRRKEIPARSLSVDVLANMKLSARSINSRTINRKQLNPKIVSPKSSDQEENQGKISPEEPAVVQNFEPPRLLRIVNPWPPPSSPNRPQLHIFMPPLEHEVHPEESEAEEGL